MQTVKSLKKKAASLFTAFVLAAPLALTAATPAAQAETPPSYPALPDPTGLPADVAKYFPADISGHWAYNYLLDLVQSDIVNGSVENGRVYVHPDANITRAEFVKLLVVALNLQADQPGKSFTDVKSTDWFYHYVQTASALGIINGTTATTFAPNANITRSEIAAIVARAFAATVSFSGTPKPFADVPANDWARPFIDKVSAAGIVNGYADNTFKPGASAARAEAMKMLYSALHLEKAALPDDKTLVDLVLNNERENYEALKAHDFNRPLQLDKQYATGYMRAMSDFNVQMLQQMTQGGMTIDAELVGTLGANVTSKSDRYAIVDLTGAQYKFTVSGGSAAPQTNTSDTSGTLLLKKEADGTWKIYGSIQKAAAAAPAGT